MSVFSPFKWPELPVFSNERILSSRFSAENVPNGKMIILGEAPLMGALTGMLSIEVCGESEKNQQLQARQARRARIWTLYDSSAQDVIHRISHSLLKPFMAMASSNRDSLFLPPGLLPYSRVCANAPTTAQPIKHLQFWVDPSNTLTRAAGLGSQWLEPLNCAPCAGLVLTQLNHHMLSSASMHELVDAGLLLANNSLDDYWLDDDC